MGTKYELKTCCSLEGVRAVQQSDFAHADTFGRQAAGLGERLAAYLTRMRLLHVGCVTGGEAACL